MIGYLDRLRVATQRITIAKLAGVSGEIALQRIATWFAARNTNDPTSWEPEQWPDTIRREVDEFAERVRANGLTLPVCHFVEWADMWSMFDLFHHWLTPPKSPNPICVHGNQYELFAYGLPDDGRLANHLAAAGPQRYDEINWFVTRLREAVNNWEELVPRSTLVVLRLPVAGCVLNHELTEATKVCPEWLADWPPHQEG